MILKSLLKILAVSASMSGTAVFFVFICQFNKLLSLYEKTYQAVYYKKRIAKTKKDIKRVDMFLKKLKTSRNDYRRDRISEDDFRSILAKYSADKV